MIEKIDTPTSLTIKSAAYNRGNGDFIVEYRKSRAYVYKQVTPEEWKAFKAASSKGRYINSFIKPHHPCKKLL